jgi:hypothetical protein
MWVAWFLAVNIRFTSTLTVEEENALAPGLLQALVTFLGLMPIAYALRIETANNRVYEHSCPTSTRQDTVSVRPLVNGTTSTEM